MFGTVKYITDMSNSSELPHKYIKGPHVIYIVDLKKRHPLTDMSKTIGHPDERGKKSLPSTLPRFTDITVDSSHDNLWNDYLYPVP
jgi:hypothetical protein